MCSNVCSLTHTFQARTLIQPHTRIHIRVHTHKYTYLSTVVSIYLHHKQSTHAHILTPITHSFTYGRRNASYHITYSQTHAAIHPHHIRVHTWTLGCTSHLNVSNVHTHITQTFTQEYAHIRMQLNTKQTYLPSWKQMLVPFIKSRFRHNSVFRPTIRCFTPTPL